MSTTDFNESIELTDSLIRVNLSPEIVEAPWSRISQLGDQIVEQIGGRKRPCCLVNLSDLEYMGSSIVALIVRVWKAIKANDGRLVVVNTNPVVKETIALAGLDKIWEVHPSVEAGCRSLNVPVQGTTDSFESSGQNIGRAERLIWIAIVMTLVVILGISVFVMNGSS